MVQPEDNVFLYINWLCMLYISTSVDGSIPNICMIPFRANMCIGSDSVSWMYVAVETLTAKSRSSHFPFELKRTVIEVSPACKGVSMSLLFFIFAETIFGYSFSDRGYRCIFICCHIG